MSAIRHVDATDSDDPRVDYPAIIEELMGLGFERIGRVLAVPAEGGFDEVAAGYEPIDARRFLDHCDVPATVLRSPDGTTSAKISWFWDSPSVRMRTRLADGALVETLRRWRYQPAVPIALMEQSRSFNIDRDMTKRNVPARGRSTAVIDTEDSAEQWRRHQVHIQSYAAQRASNPVRVDSMEDVLATMAAAFDHDYSVEQRTVGFWKPAILAYAFVGLASILALFGIGLAKEWSGLAVAAIVLAFVLAAATMPFVNLVIRRLTIIPEFMRPPFA